MKNLHKYIFYLIVLIAVFNLGKIDHERKHGEIKIQYVENVDEMQETPPEIYIWINDQQFIFDTESGEQKRLL